LNANSDSKQNPQAKDVINFSKAVHTVQLTSATLDITAKNLTLNMYFSKFIAQASALSALLNPDMKVLERRHRALSLQNFYTSNQQHQIDFRSLIGCEQPTALYR
jgi:hypothetical protein